MTISEMLLSDFDNEMANTRKALERVPQAKWDWTPHEKSKNMGWLAGHIAMMAGWGATTVQHPEFNMKKGEAPPPTPSTLADTLVLFDKGRDEFRAALIGKPDDYMMQPWSFKIDGEPVMTMPRSAMLRSMILNHIIHHRAQLTMYLRMADTPVPGMYGPSADEPQMF